MKSIYYKLLALPLLPAADIVACFHMLKAQAQQVDAKSSKQQQWIESNRRDALDLAEESNHAFYLFTRPVNNEIRGVIIPNPPEVLDIDDSDSDDDL